MTGAAERPPRPAAALVAAMRGQPEAPCVAYRCLHSARCAVRELACGAFVAYVDTGKAGPPDLATLAPWRPQVEDGQ